MRHRFIRGAHLFIDFLHFLSNNKTAVLGLCWVCAFSILYTVVRLDVCLDVVRCFLILFYVLTFLS